MTSVLAILAVALAGCGGGAGDSEGDPAVTAALRATALSAPLPFQGAPDEPIMVVVDMDFGVVGTTVVATKEGDASLYTTKGGAIIGGGSHPHIRAAALKLVSESAKHLQMMKPTTSFPLPSSGNVRFYVRTSQQVHTAEAGLPGLMDDSHPLAPLFGAAMDVGMPLQELAKKE